MGSFIKWYCRQIGKSMLSKADLEGPAYKVVRAFHSNNISLQFQMEECHLLLTDQIDLVNPEGNRLVPDVGSQERRNALSISKLKAAYYPNFRLEEHAVTEFYITRYSAPLDCGVVRSHMRILSVISLKTYERYGYTFLKEIVLRRADYNEYKISEADFKTLHPNDFEDMYLLHLQGKLNHLSGADKVHLFNSVNLWIRNIVIRKRVEDLQLGIESYQTKLNLTQPDWDASDFLFKEDYTIVSKSRAVIYKDKNDQKKMMRETEVHKFSDGTLTRILEKLDHMVKDFKLFKYNPGMESKILSDDDRMRSKDFMEDILIRASRLKKVMADKGKKSSMETFAPNDKADYYSRVTSIIVNKKNPYEMKGKFLDDLQNNAFSGTNGKDAVEHIEDLVKEILMNISGEFTKSGDLEVLES
ncbi:hypothetical protein Tco_1058492 [Tanacetum coccineum]|uniref:Uncharacterized protein n=1 Tax=Tanacetum coccineum TaxID=301880 RepID=A0ABQ5H9W8_9ASTR